MISLPRLLDLGKGEGEGCVVLYGKRHAFVPGDGTPGCVAYLAHSPLSSTAFLCDRGVNAPHHRVTEADASGPAGPPVQAPLERGVAILVSALMNRLGLDQVTLTPDELARAVHNEVMGLWDYQADQVTLTQEGKA